MAAGKCKEAIVAEGNIYYIDSKTGYLCRMDLNGKNSTVLQKSKCSSICVYDKQIIFNNDSKGGIYKISVDGGKAEKVIGDFAVEIAVCEDQIYYINADDGSKIYSVGLDGGKAVKLNDVGSANLGVSGGTLYYTNVEEELSYALDIKSGESEKVEIKHDNDVATKASMGNTNGNLFAGGRVVEKNGWIYYCDSIDSVEIGIYKMRSDGTDITLLKNNLSGARELAVNNGWVYYSEKDDSGRICFNRVKTDGSKTDTLFRCETNDYMWLVNTVGNKIYYLYNKNIEHNGDVTPRGTLCRADLTGKNREVLVDSKCVLPSINDGKIYYSIHHFSKDGSKYKIEARRVNLDGSKDERWSNHQIDGCQFYGKKIFALQQHENQYTKIVMTDKAGEKAKVIAQAYMFNISNGYIYYPDGSSYENFNSLEKMNLSTYKKEDAGFGFVVGHGTGYGTRGIYLTQKYAMYEDDEINAFTKSEL